MSAAATRSPFTLPLIERHDVGLLAIIVRPIVDCPLAAAVDIAQDRGCVRASAVDEEAPCLRPLDLVVAEKAQLLDQEKQTRVVPAGIDAVHLARIVLGQ